MIFPVEIMQIIKEFCEYREAKIIQSFNVGWKTERMLFHEKWRPFVSMFFQDNIESRLLGQNMFYGKCTMCGDSSNTASLSWEEGQEYYHRVYEFNSAFAYAVMVNMSLMDLEDFVFQFRHLAKVPLYQGPMLEHCPKLCKKIPQICLYREYE